MSWIDKLKSRWNLKSTADVLIILLVFALTGTTVLVIKRPLLSSMGEEVVNNVWFSVAYYILILPIYNVFLLFYGFLLGRFKFFWEFEKRFFSRIFGKKAERTT
ncbi:MAG TPA: DUF6787 family protein [Cyclobacteriaceae bacterium]|jgi:hypothetical protein